MCLKIPNRWGRVRYSHASEWSCYWDYYDTLYLNSTFHLRAQSASGTFCPIPSFLLDSKLIDIKGSGSDILQWFKLSVLKRFLCILNEIHYLGKILSWTRCYFNYPAHCFSSLYLKCECMCEYWPYWKLLHFLLHIIRVIIYSLVRKKKNAHIYLSIYITFSTTKF